MKPDLRAMFPKGSKAFFEANEGQRTEQKIIAETLDKIRVPKQPNKTEREFGFILEAQKTRGEIRRYEFAGITLRWFDMRYTPDYLVFDVCLANIKIRLIEVKGAHIWDRDIVRFKGARAYWPEFEFEMWQKKRGNWTRIY